MSTYLICPVCKTKSNIISITLGDSPVITWLLAMLIACWLVSWPQGPLCCDISSLPKDFLISMGSSSPSSISFLSWEDTFPMYLPSDGVPCRKSLPGTGLCDCDTPCSWKSSPMNGSLIAPGPLSLSPGCLSSFCSYIVSLFSTTSRINTEKLHVQKSLIFHILVVIMLICREYKIFTRPHPFPRS